MNTKYVGDITYLRVGSGKVLSLATVIDLCSRRLAGAIMHTDHGSQYTSGAFADACHKTGVRQSMSAIGSSADNAAAGSFNATLKREVLQGRKGWPNERETGLAAFR
ncbi:transposase [Streptomyces sp. NPDC002659]|uniref:transposase n=1 Tax=Streptomyces sp. NPDC002659 TaxID=3364656 RepID=UPI0036A227FC